MDQVIDADAAQLLLAVAEPLEAGGVGVEQVAARVALVYEVGGVIEQVAVALLGGLEGGLHGAALADVPHGGEDAPVRHALGRNLHGHARAVRAGDG